MGEKCSLVVLGAQDMLLLPKALGWRSVNTLRQGQGRDAGALEAS